MMNDVLDAILTRRSIRKYRPDPVPEELINRVMEAGSYAASGMGSQSPVMIAVTNRQVRDALSSINANIAGAGNIDPFYGAPVVIIVLADKKAPTYLYDGSLALGNMMLAAHALGLGSCWIHRAKEEFETENARKILDILGIKGEYEGIGHLILGYPDGEALAPRERKEYAFYIR